jgi:hypothetical protein
MRAMVLLEWMRCIPRDLRDRALRRLSLKETCRRGWIILASMFFCLLLSGCHSNNEEETVFLDRTGTQATFCAQDVSAGVARVETFTFWSEKNHWPQRVMVTFANGVDSVRVYRDADWVCSIRVVRDRFWVLTPIDHFVIPQGNSEDELWRQGKVFQLAGDHVIFLKNVLGERGPAVSQPATMESEMLEYYLGQEEPAAVREK